MSRGERLYRRLLKLYPSSFRAEVGDDMVELVRDCLRGVRRTGNRRALVRFWTGCLRGVLVGAIGEWLAIAREAFTGRPGYSNQRSDRIGDSMLTTLKLDLRFALRTMRRQLGATGASVLSLSLGIGALGALFGLADAVLLRPLPFPEPDRLVALWNRYDGGPTSLSPPDFVDRLARPDVLQRGAAYEFTRSLTFERGGDSRRARAARVTSAFFDTLGVPPALGLVRFPDETGGEPDHQIVLSHAFWQRELAGREDVLGQTIRIEGLPLVVTAVMPPSFAFPSDAELWVPLAFSPSQLADANRGNENLRMVARLVPGVTIEQARAAMDAVASSVIERVPERSAYLASNGWGSVTRSLKEEIVGDVRPALWSLVAAGVMVLSVIILNTANLLIAGIGARGRELAVRRSLGATRIRLVRQLLTESGVLAVLGGVGGLWIASAGLRVALPLVPHQVPRLDEVAPDARMVLFVLVVALGSGLLFGTAPAWRGAAGRLVGGRTIGSRGADRMRRALVVAEVALALVLLIGTGLLVRTHGHLATTELGFETEGRWLSRISLPRGEFSSREARQGFAQELVVALEQRPEVAAVGLADRMPLDGEVWTSTFHVEGRVARPGEKALGASLMAVSEGFFETLGVRFAAGGPMPMTEVHNGRRLAVIDEDTAERLWPGDAAVGKRIAFESDAPPEKMYEIVGVVEPVRQVSLRDAAPMQIYLSNDQLGVRDLAILVRGFQGRAVDLAGVVRHEVQALVPGLPVYRVEAVEQVITSALALPRFHAALLGGFAAVALLLAAIGLYGVLSHAVVQRTGEVGLRMAFGASRSKILGMMLREGLGLTMVGLVVGWSISLPTTRLLNSLLAGVEAADPATYLGYGALLAGVAFLACMIPARRAARLDPSSALRAE